jgi:hypothetical protein
MCLHLLRRAVARLVELLRYKPECRGYDSRWCDWDLSFRPHYDPGGDSFCIRNEYQDYFPKGKGGRYLNAPIVLKSGSLILLEPSGPVQACTEIVFLHVLTFSLSLLCLGSHHNDL